MTTTEQTFNIPAGIRLHTHSSYCQFPPAGQEPVSHPGLNGENISILIWNIAKGNREGWQDDLRRLSAGKDLVLLQEATLSDDIAALINATSHDFAPGYRTSAWISGVWTASRAGMLSACSLQSREPLLTTPKMTIIVEYPIADGKQTLLVANIHAVNFSLGITEFRRQLASVATVLEFHDGPVIFAGDFNTWSRNRYKMLQTITERLSLKPVAFYHDHRMRAFGKPVDHIFYRGLRLLTSRSETVQSSDHNPITAELQLMATQKPH